MTKIVRLPTTTRKPPSPPPSLGPAGRAEWRKVVAILSRDGGLDPKIEALLVLYCEAVEGASDAGKILKKQGRTFQSPAGIKAHPMIRAQVTYQQNALRYAQALGLIERPKEGPREPSSGLDY